MTVPLKKLDFDDFDPNRHQTMPVWRPNKLIMKRPFKDRSFNKAIVMHARALEKRMSGSRPTLTQDRASMSTNLFISGQCETQPYIIYSDMSRKSFLCSLLNFYPRMSTLDLFNAY